MKKSLICFMSLIFLSFIITSCTTLDKNSTSNNPDLSPSKESIVSDNPNPPRTEKNILSTSDLSYFRKNINEVGEDELIRSFEYTFPNGEEAFTTYDDPKTFVMVNGAFEPSIDVIEENNSFFISINLFNKLTDLNVAINNEKVSITYNNQNIELSVGQLTTYINKESFKLDTSPIRLNDTIYIPLQFITDDLNLNVSNLDKTHRIICNSRVIVIDEYLPENEFNNFSKEEALKYLKESLHESYKLFEKYLVDYEHNKSFKENTLKNVKDGIDTLEFSFAFSKYYVFRGEMPYEVYVDVYNKNIYFQYETIRIAKIAKIDLNNPEIFKIGYLID